MMALRKRAETLQIHSEAKNLDIKVLHFQCHDETTLGKHHKKWDWAFDIQGSQQTWELKVDEAVVGNKMLKFSIDGKDVFKNKMQQDFEHKLPVRGTLNLDKPYEVQSLEFNSSDQWHPATLTVARGDGRYEAEVLMPPDRYGNQKKVHYPLVEANQIRDPFTKEAIQVPSCILSLTLKKDAALSPELTINGTSFASHFCVQSPAKNQPPAEIKLAVSKDRTNVTGDVGHGKLKDALDATKPGYKVRSKGCTKTKLKCEWNIQIGAFGEHHIVAEKKSKSSKEVSVTIDGNLVVGGSAADLGGTEWSADVAIQGGLALKYKLHKTDTSGVVMDQSEIVTKMLLHSNTMRISVPDLSNLGTAMLECDDVEYSDLQQYKVPPPEPMIDGSLETFEMTHDMSVPYLVDDASAPRGFVSDFAKLIPGGAYITMAESSAEAYASNFARGLSAMSGGLATGYSGFANLVPCMNLLGNFTGKKEGAVEVIDVLPESIPAERLVLDPLTACASDSVDHAKKEDSALQVVPFGVLQPAVGRRRPSAAQAA